MLLFLQTKEEEVFAPEMTRSSAMQSGEGGGHLAAGHHIEFEFQRQCAEPQPRLFE